MRKALEKEQHVLGNLNLSALPYDCNTFCTWQKAMGGFFFFKIKYRKNVRHWRNKETKLSFAFFFLSSSEGGDAGYNYPSF